VGQGRDFAKRLRDEPGATVWTAQIDILAANRNLNYRNWQIASPDGLRK
jgi:hypothetical protein